MVCELRGDAVSWQGIEPELTVLAATLFENREPDHRMFTAHERGVLQHFARRAMAHAFQVGAAAPGFHSDPEVAEYAAAIERGEMEP
jgi:hypothetical protein